MGLNSFLRVFATSYARPVNYLTVLVFPNFIIHLREVNVIPRYLLGEEKYGPGSEPQWKAGGGRYPNLYKAILEEPSRILRTKLMKDIPDGKTGDGRNTRRPARTRTRNQ